MCASFKVPKVFELSGAWQFRTGLRTQYTRLLLTRAHVFPASAAHLDQFDGADKGLVNWQGNPNAQIELRGIIQWIPSIDLAGSIKYPFKSKPPFAKIGQAGITENTMKNVELKLGAKFDLDKCTFVKAVAEVGPHAPNTTLTERLVFKTGVTTKVQGTKVCCGVAINGKRLPS